MGQQSAIQFFKKNPESFFDVDDIAKFLGIKKNTAYSILKKLKEADDLEYREIVPKQGPVKKMFCFRIKDEFFEDALHEYGQLRTSNKFVSMNSSTVASLLILKELKILNERVKHLEELGVKK